ncbi:sulfatase [Akkermansiaceae bacterium]|nr:sulfatase [Akkermansiaceae bacterium]
MTTIVRMKYLVTSALVSALCSMPISGAEAAKPRNVIFIVVDDLRTELGCYGVEEVISPNIDRLAKKGVLFHNGYAQYPVCNPSRSSFLSGKRPDETGIVTNTLPFRKAMADLVSLPQLFRQNGYFTAGIGKIFHLAEPRDGKQVLFEDPLSWQHFYDGTKDATKLGRTGEGRNLTHGKIPWCTWLAAAGGDEDQADGLNAKAAVRILEEHHDKPFFLGLGFHKPHDPFIAPKKYFDLYPEGETKLAVEPDDRSEQVRYAIPNHTDFASFTDRERREFKRAYQACVSFTDAQLGKVFDAMDRLKLWDDTIVVLIGDHGYHLGEHEWWNKVTVYERCAGAPMMAWVPGAKGMGQPTHALIEFVDIYPTLIDCAGLKAPHPLSGESFRAVLEDPKLPGKKAAYTQVNRGKTVGRSVRTQRWRYTEWGKDGKDGIELYDHNADTGEYHNLGGKPGYAETSGELRKLLATGFQNAN